MAYAAIAQGKSPSIYVAQSWHSKFAGAHGNNIRNASHEFGVKIKMPRRESGECGIIIEGNKDQIEKTRLYFQKILGFQIGTKPLSMERVKLMPLEVSTILSNHDNFMKIVRNYGVGVLFGNQQNGNICLIQGRSMDIKLALKEFEKIISRNIDIIAKQNGNDEAEQKQQGNGKGQRLNRAFKSKLNLGHGNYNEVLFFSPTDEDDCEDFLIDFTTLPIS